MAVLADLRLYSVFIVLVLVRSSLTAPLSSNQSVSPLSSLSESSNSTSAANDLVLGFFSHEVTAGDAWLNREHPMAFRKLEDIRVGLEEYIEGPPAISDIGMIYEISGFSDLEIYKDYTGLSSQWKIEYVEHHTASPSFTLEFLDLLSLEDAYDLVHAQRHLRQLHYCMIRCLEAEAHPVYEFLDFSQEREDYCYVNIETRAVHCGSRPLGAHVVAKNATMLDTRPQGHATS